MPEIILIIIPYLESVEPPVIYTLYYLYIIPIVMSLDCILFQDWMEELLKCDAEFDEEAKYGLVSGSSLNQKGGNDAMECVMGSYRKLSVD